MGIPRSRVLGGFTNQVGHVFGGPMGAPEVHTYPFTHVGWKRTMNDHVNPGFAGRRNRGEVVFSPMDIDDWQYQGGMVDSSWLGSHDGRPWEEGGIRPYADFPHYPTFPSAFDDPLARASAVNQANAGVTPNYALVAVTVAELNKTRAMFNAAGQTARDFANIMITAARSLKGKKNTVKRQKKAMRDISNLWLQARYGWMPVIYDVQGSIRSFSEPYHLRNTSRGVSTIERSGDGQVVGSWRGTYGYSYSWKQVTTYRSGIMYENLQDLGAMYSSRLGLSITDALTVPWELVYLSFVVDWFIDIGDWLRAITPKPGTRTLASWLVIEGTTEINLNSPFVACTQSGWTGSASGEPFKITNFRKSRSAGATPTIPGYGSGLSTKRSIDSAALAFQQLKGLLKFAHR